MKFVTYVHCTVYDCTCVNGFKNVCEKWENKKVVFNLLK